MSSSSIHHNFLSPTIVMEVFKVVPTLGNLAIAAAYKAIEDDFSLCYGHEPSGKRLYMDCPESDRIRLRIRSRLDQTLGVNTQVSDQVRKSLLHSHNKNFYCKRANTADDWLFLDCVLSEPCEEISSAAASDRLTSVIGKRSPYLMKLRICFQAMDQMDFSQELEWKMSALIRPLASLEFLTSLCLSEITSPGSTIVMGLIGEACASLTSLTIEFGDVEHPGEDMLALIMGRSVYLLKSEHRPSWFRHGELGRTDVPHEYRTPICSSLRELNLDTYGWSAEDSAFTLRNIPSLQKFDYSTSTGGIEMLHYQQQQGIINSFQGQLSLTTVDGVDVKNGSMLRAIGDLCPSLNEAIFSDIERSSELEADELSLEEAEVILRKWPKLAEIELYSVSHEYVKRILKVFGPELLHLTIWGREDQFTLADFALCPKLEHLSIHGCTLDENEDAAAFDPATFLPNLKSFASDCCLGSLSRFFEAKSSLISLNVHCSHLGLEFKKGRPLYAEVESVLKMIRDRETWTHLETLSIKEYVGLSMDKMARILPQLRRLKTVILPQTIPSCDVLLYESIKKEFSNRKPPAVIHFGYFYKSVKPCLYLS